MDPRINPRINDSAAGPLAFGFFEDFVFQSPTALLTGTAISSGTAATNAANGGWARLAGAATTDNSGYQLQAAGAHAATALKSMTFKARGQLGEATSANVATESDLWLGFLPVDTSIVASEPVDGIYFLKADGGTTLKCEIRVNNATPTYTLSHTTAFDTSVHTFGISVDPVSDSRWDVKWFLDGAVIATARDQALPASSVLLAASVAFQSGDNTGTKRFDLDYIGSYQER
jgi:hypothetical protein